MSKRVTNVRGSTGRLAPAAVAMAVAATLLGGASSARAAIQYWDVNGIGAGATDTDVANGIWSNATNWTADGVNGTAATVGFTNGSDAVFSAAADATGSSAVDLQTTYNVNSLTLEEGNVSVTTANARNITFRISTGVSDANTGNIAVADGSTLSLGVILTSSSLGFTKLGGGTLELSAGNSYAGTMNLNAGTVRLTQAGAVGSTGSTIANGATVIVNAGATLDLYGRTEVAGTYRVAGGSILNSGSEVTPGDANDDPSVGIQAAGSGTIELESGTVGVQIRGATNTNKTTGGTVTLSGRSNNYTGTTTVSAGRLIVTGIHGGFIDPTFDAVKNPVANEQTALLNLTGGTLAVSGGGVDTGTFADTGRVGRVNATGGTIDPGTLADTTGLMFVRGGTADALTIGAAATLEIDIAGAAAGAGYDQVRVSSQGTAAPGASTAVSLAGALSVDLLGGYAPTDGQLFFIITQSLGAVPTNPATVAPTLGPIGGTFAGLADGATFTQDGQEFQISYYGNSTLGTFTGGNDVVLRAVVPEPATIGAVVALGGLVLRRRRRRA